MAAVLAAAAVLVFAPGIAQAAFNGATSASLPVSSALITASTATVSASCKGSTLTITVTSWAISDPRLTGVFTVSSGGSTVFTGTSKQSGGGTYTAAITPHTGTWTWTVQNQYPVPGTSNTWSGTPMTGQFTCT